MTDEYGEFESNIEDIGASKAGVVLKVDGEEVVISTNYNLKRLKSAIEIVEGYRDGFD